MDYRLSVISFWDDFCNYFRQLTIYSDGAKNCGLFCAFANAVSSMHIDGGVDIYQLVRLLQLRRQEFFSDFVSIYIYMFTSWYKNRRCGMIVHETATHLLDNIVYHEWKLLNTGLIRT